MTKHLISQYLAEVSKIIQYGGNSDTTVELGEDLMSAYPTSLIRQIGQF